MAGAPDAALLRRKLEAGGVEDAGFEARQIARAAKDQEEAEAMLRRRLDGEPLQYILGVWEFYGLPFFVGPGVLIPRPDTEILVEAVLLELGDRPLAVADLCAGSGAIAVAVAKHSRAAVTAVELDETALGYLRRNVEANGAAVEIVQADILRDAFGTFDLIVSNPPYIRSDTVDTLSREVKREPRRALDGGGDGLTFYRALCDRWISRLVPGGKLMVEIGYDQERSVRALFAEAGLRVADTVYDYGGNPRVIIGTVPPAAT